MSQQLDIARSHLETMVERVTGLDKAMPDHDGDYFVKTHQGGFYARVDGDEMPILRVFTVISKDISCSADLLEELNAINCRLTFPRAIWVQQQVLMETNATALETTTHQFNLLCAEVASASEEFGPQILHKFGGTPSFAETREEDQGEPTLPRGPGFI